MTCTDDGEINNEPAPWGAHPLHMVAVTSDESSPNQATTPSGMHLQQQQDRLVSAPAALPTPGADAPGFAWST